MGGGRKYRRGRRDRRRKNRRGRKRSKAEKRSEGEDKIGGERRDRRSKKRSEGEDWMGVWGSRKTRTEVGRRDQKGGMAKNRTGGGDRRCCGVENIDIQCIIHSPDGGDANMATIHKTRPRNYNVECITTVSTVSLL